ncbi:Reverse transcriptase (RNA-dependent DNA polymerase) [Popillia japonica]|uniref:Reverse transcriptase (RNA-dependent DNA polymerase) n=1 Tax=Popillia japonica TaxID=7064 RepID=A0AAW1IUB4_POPJA
MRPPNIMDAVEMENIVRALFPQHPIRPEMRFDNSNDCPPFTHEELEIAFLSLKNRKAPGPDGIPSEILKIVFQCSPSLLLRMYNVCLEYGVFPARWKCARLVLIKKKTGEPDDPCLEYGVFPARWKCARLVLIKKKTGEPDDPSSYRPLCMLDTAGKILEKLLKARLRTAVETAGDLSPRQYGFRKGRSTIDALQENGTSCDSGREKCL